MSGPTTTPEEASPALRAERWPSRDTVPQMGAQVSWSYRAIVAWSVLLVRRYYRVEVRGEAFPDGPPALVVQNHSNGLVDAHFPLCTTTRPIRLLVKYKLLRTFFIGWILRSMDAVPMYRKKDGADTRQNAESFAEIERALRERAVIAVFPEGESLNSIGLRPMKSGVARMAISAESRSEEPLGLIIMPVGVTYEDRDRLRSEASALIGPPIEIAPIVAATDGELRAGIRQAMGRIREALEALILHAEDEDEHRAAVALERIAARSDAPLGLRRKAALDALRAAAAQEEGREVGPEAGPEADARRRLVIELGDRLAAADLTGDDVLAPPPSAGAALAPLVWAGPLAALACVVWGLPALVARFVSRFAKTPDKVVTLRMLACFGAAPLWIVALVLAALGLGGGAAALAAFGLAALSVATFVPMLDALRRVTRAMRRRALARTKESDSTLERAIRSIRQAFPMGEERVRPRS